MSTKEHLLKVFDEMGLIPNQTSIEKEDLETDLQGWRSEHPLFNWAIEVGKPELIIEVGTWKGASLVTMHNIAKELGLNPSFISVDTWLGSNGPLWHQSTNRNSMQIVDGYPTMYKQFIHNMLDVGMMDSVFPMPMTSSCAYEILLNHNIQADVIYIDAGHLYYDVLADINHYYELLKPGGVMIGDDYAAALPGVIKAVNKFAAEKTLRLTCYDDKWGFRKIEL